MAEQFAIVTGASSGIGLSLAKGLAARGYDLAICSSGERFQPAARELRSQGVQATEIMADSATREGVNQLWAQVQSLGRNIDVACIKDHVYAASAKTKVEGMLANVTPGNVKDAMHEKMARPKAS